MFSIRDSAEPEDSLENENSLPSSPPGPPALLPIQLTPITFDLPSITSVSMYPSSIITRSQKSNSPAKKSTKRRKTMDYTVNVKVNTDSDVWEFPIDSPARTSKRSTTMNERTTRGNLKRMEEASPVYKTKRRNSTTPASECSGTRDHGRGSSVGIEESPRMLPVKRKSTRQIED